jgi:hypothetical protein
MPEQKYDKVVSLDFSLPGRVLYSGFKAYNSESNFIYRNILDDYPRGWMTDKYNKEQFNLTSKSKIILYAHSTAGSDHISSDGKRKHATFKDVGNLLLRIIPDNLTEISEEFNGKNIKRRVTLQCSICDGAANGQRKNQSFSGRLYKYLSNKGIEINIIGYNSKVSSAKNAKGTVNTYIYMSELEEFDRKNYNRLFKYIFNKEHPDGKLYREVYHEKYALEDAPADFKGDLKDEISVIKTMVDKEKYNTLGVVLLPNTAKVPDGVAKIRAILDKYERDTNAINDGLDKEMNIINEIHDVVRGKQNTRLFRVEATLNLYRTIYRLTEWLIERNIALSNNH